jgi:ribosomal protein S18 acetylase RimI-like enzyme
VTSVRLRPLRADEFPEWSEAHICRYADGMVEHAGLAREAAERKASSDVASVLPDGIATEGTWFWAIEDQQDRVVGSVFLGVRQGEAWLYDIVVGEADRGRGVGRAAMLALEQEVRALGYASVGLNVWGGNEVARSLYRSLGYTERSVGMTKTLDRP